MANFRVLPPAGGATLVVNGRSYKATSGTTLDVADFDSTELEANGWTVIGLVGLTAQRPANPVKGKPFIDTTLNKPVFHDGAIWRDHTGAAV